jgi:hypothetical protein
VVFDEAAEKLTVAFTRGDDVRSTIVLNEDGVSIDTKDEVVVNGGKKEVARVDDPVHGGTLVFIFVGGVFTEAKYFPAGLVGDGRASAEVLAQAQSGNKAVQVPLDSGLVTGGAERFKA